MNNKIIVVPVVTIDGASGTGKGVVAQALSNQLSWHFLDSGALYRVLALLALQRDMMLENKASLGSLALNLDVRFISSDSGIQKILLEGQDVTEKIRTEFVGGVASKISVFSEVRDALLERQRAFRKSPGLITDGRDMGTVVFPDACLKIFLTASPEERARRRYNQLKEKGIDVNLPALADELRLRDQRDSTREISPLCPAHDAICVDTDNLSIAEVVDCIRMKMKNIL